MVIHVLFSSHVSGTGQDYWLEHATYYPQLIGGESAHGLYGAGESATHAEDARTGQVTAPGNKQCYGVSSQGEASCKDIIRMGEHIEHKVAMQHTAPENKKLCEQCEEHVHKQADIHSESNAGLSFSSSHALSSRLIVGSVRNHKQGRGPRMRGQVHQPTKPPVLAGQAPSAARCYAFLWWVLVTGLTMHCNFILCLFAE